MPRNFIPFLFNIIGKSSSAFVKIEQKTDNFCEVLYSFSHSPGMQLMQYLSVQELLKKSLYKSETNILHLVVITALQTLKENKINIPEFVRPEILFSNINGCLPKISED
jgi:hypothetical protein